MWPYSGIFWRWFEQQISVHFCTEITRKGWRRFIDNPHSVSGKSMLLQCSPVSELHKNYTNFFHYLPLMRHCAILIKIYKKNNYTCGKQIGMPPLTALGGSKIAC